jgi:restriction system protein
VNLTRWQMKHEADRLPLVADFNYYDLLRLDSSATPEEIGAAFRRISKQVHPDAGGSEALFQQVNLAYETLSDPVRREAYDHNGFVDNGVKNANATAPGWRRTDAGSTKNPGSSGGSATGSAGQGTHEPPPTPPPTGTGQAGNISDLKVGDFRSGMRRRIAESPSGALLIAGVLLLFFSSDFGGSASDLILLGCVAMFIGFVGLLGRRKAAHAAAMRRAGIGDIDAMNGTQFELRLKAAFELAGFTVYHVGGRGDLGADLVLDAPGNRVVVQAKRWNKSVGPGAVQEAAASRSHYRASRAIVITNSNFTKAAYELARSNSVEMWDRDRLIDFLATQDSGPARTGGTLLADELRAGAPSVFKGLLVIFLGMFAAALSASSSGRRRKRKR